MAETHSTHENQPHRGRRALTLDAVEYLEFLEETGWTDAQKREFIAALWEIIVGFVDLGFKLSAVQYISGEKTLVEDSPSMVAFEGISEINNAPDATLSTESTAQRMDS